MGVGVAIALEAAAPKGVLDGIGWAAIPAAALLGLIVRIGAAGSTVLAAVLIHKGLSIPAAFVFTGVAAYVFSSRQQPYSLQSVARTMLAVSGAVLLVVLSGPATPPLHGLAAHVHPWIEWSSAIAIALWALAELVLSGPRAWFAPLSSSESSTIH